MYVLRVQGGPLVITSLCFSGYRIVGAVVFKVVTVMRGEHRTTATVSDVNVRVGRQSSDTAAV